MLPPTTMQMGATMQHKAITDNTLFYGDNLDILREYIPSESVDLVYIDPPFNSSRNYNVLFRDESGKESEAQIAAFTDTWHWSHTAEQTYSDLVTDAPQSVSAVVEALRTSIGTNPMMAYLVMMTARLVELHRVLKPTGSLYLHCDPSASHYLKVVLDALFGPERFMNEIIWRRTRAHNDQKITRFGAIHDTLLFYSKSDKWTWNKIYIQRDESAPKTHDLYRHTDGKLYRKGDCRAPGGRGPRYEWNGHTENWRFTQEEARRLESEGRIVYTRSGVPRVLRPVDLERGSPLQDLWVDIDPPNSGSAEILGYPTQKPLALLERIIQASSNPGDLVLDAFAGCGTTVAAAQKLGRRWIGIDITHLSIALLKYRLKEMFPDAAFKVIGEPEDVGAAQQLANDDRYQFQWWALSLVRARPLGGQEGSRTGKKGSDKGIDGLITFIEDQRTGKAQKVLVQVKSGNVKSGDIRDLRGTIEREGAAIGVFITLAPPTRDMQQEAVSAGFYRSVGWGKNYPRLQILTIADLLRGAQVDMPPQFGTFKQSQRIQQADAGQAALFEE
jgi:site-specific DNA-methyltransferase (adenine-specific)